MRRVLLPLGEATARQLAGSDPLVGGQGCITWHSTRETTGSAAASYILNDGPAGNGQILMDVTLSAGESTRDYVGLHCVSFTEGLYVNVTSGAIAGAVVAYVDHDCTIWLVEAHLAVALTDMAVMAAAPSRP